MASEFIIYLLTAFMLIATADRTAGNPLGLGSEFEKAFTAMGPLALSMAGIMVSSEWIGRLLVPTAGAFFRLFGGNACMAGSLVLSMDTGAYPLAHAISPGNPDAANFSAIILASMMGPTISFNIPVALGILDKKDLPSLATGSLCSILCIPFGCITGGLLAGFDKTLVLCNTIPVLLFSLLIAAGLWRFPIIMIRGFRFLSGLLLCYLTFMLALAILQELTPIQVLALRPLSEVWETVGIIAMMLAGAYPFMKVFSSVLRKPLGKLAVFLDIEDMAVAAMAASIVNSIPALTAARDLSPKGKVIVIAFTCCSCFALGDYLGFCAGTQPHLILPMIAGKMTAAILAVGVSLLLAHRRPELFSV